MTIALEKRSLTDVLIAEPLELAKAQPHQILLSAGSVALMGQFAASSQIVDGAVGYCIAVGVEWAYLRGLASDSRAPTRWGGILNWSAFGIVVLWGVLWCMQRFGALDEGTGGVWLAAAHVVPVAWLSLCSAQCHRAAVAAERRQVAAEQARRDQEAAEQRTRDAAQQEKDREYERWERAQRLQAQLKIEAANARRSVRANTPATPPISAPGTATNTDGEQLREQIVRTLTADPAANRAALARSLGIGRTRLYELIADAKQRGELA